MEVKQMSLKLKKKSNDTKIDNNYSLHYLNLL